MSALTGWLNRQPYLLLVITSLSWGGNAVAGRLAVGEVSPMVLTSLRWVLVCALLVAIARKETSAALPVLVRRWRYLLVMGPLGFTCFNALFYWAAYHTTAVNMTILQGAIPALVLIGAFALFGTRVTAIQIAGSAVTLVGVGVIAAQGSFASLRQLDLNVGDVGILISNLFYASYTIGLRNRPQIPGLALFSGLALFAFLTSLPLLAYEIYSGDVRWPTLTGWVLLAYIAVFPSVMGQVFFMRAVDLIGPGRAGIFTNLVPIFGALLAVVILGEPFHFYHLAALGLVLGGIAMAERGRQARAG